MGMRLCRYTYLAAVLAGVAVGHSVAAAAPSMFEAPGSSLASAAAVLDRASTRVRADFVRIAVEEIADAYLTETAWADTDSNAKQKRWRRATRAYVGELWAMVDALELGAEINFLAAPGDTLRVILRRGHEVRQFMVAGPRPAGRDALERRIVERLCAAGYCGGDLLAAAAPVAPPIVELSPVAGDGAPARSDRSINGDGLTCNASASRHTKLRTRACELLLGELRELAAALATVTTAGVTITWSELELLRGDSDAHRLRTGATSATLELALPALHQAQELMAGATPWLQTRVIGKVTVYEFVPPARLVYSPLVAAR